MSLRAGLRRKIVKTMKFPAKSSRIRSYGDDWRKASMDYCAAKEGNNTQAPAVRPAARLSLAWGAGDSCGSFRAGPTGRRESFWGMQTPGSASFHPGLLSLAPSGSCLRCGGRASRMRFVGSQVPEAGPGAPGHPPAVHQLAFRSRSMNADMGTVFLKFRRFMVDCTS